MNHKHLLAAIALTLTAVGCKQGDKTVEYPLIEMSSTRSMDISKVELTDSVTTLHVDARNRPHYWIRIASGTHLVADGKEYALIGAEGITPDSLFRMPESGEAQFTLSFEPLPKNTRSFDFIEGNEPGAWRLWGIDLTGKKTYGRMEGVPEELLHVDMDAHVPAPELKVGESTVRIHCPGSKAGMLDGTSIFVNDIFGNQEEYPVTFDGSTGEAMFRLMQYGPVEAFLYGDFCYSGTFFLAAGEDVDLYIDIRQTGRDAMRNRDSYRENEELRSMSPSYVSGTYQNLNNAKHRFGQKDMYVMNLYNGEFADYKMSADEYAGHVERTYRALCDSVETGDQYPLGKEYNIISLKQQALAAITDGNFFREHNYRSTHDAWDYDQPLDYEPDPIRPEHVADMLRLVDMDNIGLGMGFYDFAGVPSRYPAEYWAKVLPGGKGQIRDLAVVATMVEKAKNAELTEEDLDVLKAMDNPFYLEAFRTMQDNASARLASLNGVEARETPDVEKEKLFDAIVGPHKGKLVVVDFWNTWCGPCREAIRHSELQKDGELGGDDIVWIYIANETSPIVKYKDIIQGVRGVHYRLNREQWDYVCDYFRIDGIPSYVLVEKDGSYRLTNEFRDHEVMKNTLLQKR